MMGASPDNAKERAPTSTDMMHVDSQSKIDGSYGQTLMDDMEKEMQMKLTKTLSEQAQ